MEDATVEWDETRVRVRSVRELDEILDRLDLEAAESRRPLTVVIYADAGPTLGIGVGNRLSVLTFEDSLDPAYYISVGDMSATGSIWFDVGGEPTEFELRRAVPINVAREAVRAFFRTGRRPEDVRWATG